MSENKLPAYKTPIIFYSIIVGLMIAVIIIHITLHIISGWTLDIIGIIAEISIIEFGIVIPIILIVVDIIAPFIHEKVSLNFEYLPLIIGLANAILSGLIMIIALFSGFITIFDGMTTLHIPYFGFYLAMSLLIISSGVLFIGSLVMGIKIAKYE